MSCASDAWLPSMHPSKTSAFFFCRSNIRSSMVSAVQKRVAITGRV